MTIGKGLIYVVLSLSLTPGPAFVKPDIALPSLGAINKWVYDSMRVYYYWAKDMPAHPDYLLPTEVFFNKLLSPKDRFSWISNRSTVGPPKSPAEIFGFHYAIIPARLAGVITCVVPGSAAYYKGLKRGMVFTKVNNKPINNQTKQALHGASVVLQLAADSSRVAMQSMPVPPRAVYATQVFERNGTKTGYLAYFLCAEEQDAVLLQQMEKLKKTGVTEFILDLRYNTGGSVASVAKLAALLTPVFDLSKTFITYKSNRHTEKQSFQKAISFSNSAAGNLQGHHIGLSRIYILTGATTASAAELLVNNLSAFLQVIRIGETTRGKDEAAFPIEDPHHRIPWILMPTIYKISDAKGSGNYAGGIKPHYFVRETDVLPLQALGLPGDPLVDKALQLIYGGTAVAVMKL